VLRIPAEGGKRRVHGHAPPRREMAWRHAPVVVEASSLSSSGPLGRGLSNENADDAIARSVPSSPPFYQVATRQAEQSAWL
jgi:hypothetical protein